MGDDSAGKGGGHHQQKQPHHPIFIDVPDPGLEVGLLRRENCGHALHVLGGLLPEYLHGIVGGNGAHQLAGIVHHGQLYAVHPLHQGYRLLLVIIRGENGPGRAHKLVQPLVIGSHDQLAEGKDPQQQPLLIHHIAVAHKVLGHTNLAQAGQRLPGAHERGKHQHLTGHDGPDRLGDHGYNVHVLHGKFLLVIKVRLSPLPDRRSGKLSRLFRRPSTDTGANFEFLYRDLDCHCPWNVHLTLFCKLSPGR